MADQHSFSIEELHGEDARKHFEEIAKVRFKVFREFPFLYEGDWDYERRYLNAYFTYKESLVILARKEDKLIGVSTAIPLKFEDEQVKKAYLDAKRDIDSIMYFGESMIDREYRGLGLGKEFFVRRLNHCKRIPGIKVAAFFTAAFDPAKAPSDYNSPVHLWKKFGFAHDPELRGTYSWKTIGDDEETDKEMIYYSRML